jgi:hypothetical protein
MREHGYESCSVLDLDLDFPIDGSSIGWFGISPHGRIARARPGRCPTFKGAMQTDQRNWRAGVSAQSDAG